MYAVKVCVNDHYNLPWSIDSTQNTLVQITNYENKTISHVKNVTWKYCRENFRFLGRLNGRYYHKSWYFRHKNHLSLTVNIFLTLSTMNIQSFTDEF